MMFGHHNDDDQKPQDSGEAPAELADAVAEAENQAGSQPEEQPAAPNAADGAAAQSDSSAPPEPPADDQTANSQDQTWQHPGTPLNDDQEQISDIISPAGGFPKRPTYQYPKGSPIANEPADKPANRELTDVRSHALEELEPLLEKLDLPPEERFLTILMIIQNSNNEELIKKAYEAAHAIKDDAIRARALYDIVNEVNYFTNPPQGSQSDQATD
jgi:hypothetical protein